MSRPQPLPAFIQGLIRAEKARQNLSFAQLSAMLHTNGIQQSATNLSTKVGRGNMSAQLFLAIMKVLGQGTIRLDDIELPKPQRRKPAGGARKQGSRKPA